MQAIDVLAKLLASENITVVRANTRTASFDIKKRVLVIPQWKEMNPEVEEMLILHEVGHALFTTESGYMDAVQDERVLAQYANVVEDVRIERKMKERYPGSRKTFFLGYKSLNDRDFFGVRDTDLSDYVLIDRINLYYKVGYNCGVRFSDDERKFLIRIERAETEKEVIDLAREIYEFSKKEVEEKKSKMKDYFNDINFEEDDEDMFGDYDDYDDSSEDEDEEESEFESKSRDYSSSDKFHEENLDEELESKTYTKMKEKLEDMSDQDVVVSYVYPRFCSKSFSNFEHFVSYKTIISEIQEWSTRADIHLSKRENSSNTIVSYLLKEFEMKKSATAYRYAKISKLGQIDAKKLYSYKLKDDIFRQIMKTKDSKNHGMIFLLDWSGSMDNYLDEILDQVVNLALFCHRAQIPFQVLAFSDRYTHFYLEKNRKHLQYDNTHDNLGIGRMDSFNLLEFFSNKMTNVEMNQMINYLTVNRRLLPYQFNLGSTPLNDSLVFMADYVGQFIKKNNVEKMSFITLTDGESSSLDSFGRSLYTGSFWEDGRRKSSKCYLRDPITKKEYRITSSASDQTEALLKLIKDRYNVNSLGFFIVKNTNREVNRFFNNNFSDTFNLNTQNNIRIGLKSDGYYIFNNMPGRDQYYLLDSKKLNVEDGNFESLDSNSNSRQIAKTFSKVMNTRKTSRVVLNSFIEKVS